MNKMRICKVCQKEIAKSAEVCPSCGAKLKMGLMKKIGIGFGIVVALFIVGSISSKDSLSTTANSQQSTSSEQQKKSEPEKPNWNTSETDATKNGNIDIAVKLIKSNGDLKSKATTPDISSLLKAPWKYYGQSVKFTGVINDVSEYPAGSDESSRLGGGESGQIVISNDTDGSVIDMYIVGTTGDLKKGDRVTLCGYPIGLVDLQNMSGAKKSWPCIIGNSFDKQ